MVAPAKKALRSMGLNVLGGISAYFIAQGIAMTAESFFAAPQAVATTIFVVSYSGVVTVCVFRVWEDAKVLTQNLSIVIIANEQETLPAFPEAQLAAGLENTWSEVGRIIYRNWLEQIGDRANNSPIPYL